MGSSTSKEPSEQQKPQAAQQKKAFVLTSEHTRSILSAHAALLKKQEGAPDPTRVVAGVLAKELRLPADLAAWIAGEQGVTAIDLVAVTTRCVDPDGRRTALFEAYSDSGGMLSMEGLRRLLEGTLAVAMALAEDFGGLRLDDLKGKAEPGGVISHLISLLGDESPIPLDGKSTIPLTLFQRQRVWACMRVVCVWCLWWF